PKLMKCLCPHCGVEPVPVGELWSASFERPIVCYGCSGISVPDRSRLADCALYACGLAFAIAVCFGLLFLPLETALLILGCIALLSLTVSVYVKLMRRLRAASGSEIRTGRRREALRKRSFVFGFLFLLWIALFFRGGGI